MNYELQITSLEVFERHGVGLRGTTHPNPSLDCV